MDRKARARKLDFRNQQVYTTMKVHLQKKNSYSYMYVKIYTMQIIKYILSFFRK